MLQGNPFETELAVRDRTMQVRNEVEPRQASAVVKSRTKVGGWLHSLLSAIRMPEYTAPDLKPVNDK